MGENTRRNGQEGSNHISQDSFVPYITIGILGFCGKHGRAICITIDFRKTKMFFLKA